MVRRVRGSAGLGFRLAKVPRRLRSEGGPDLGALARWCVGSEGPRGLGFKEPSMMSPRRIAFFVGFSRESRRGIGGAGQGGPARAMLGAMCTRADPPED